MKTVALQELYDLEQTYWWHVGRLSIIDEQLRRVSRSNKKLRILNIGSGTGGTLPTLLKHGVVTNVDTSKEALAFLKANGYEGTLVHSLKLPYKDNTYDIVAALDVLEHIEDENTALREWLRVLKPGGTLLVTVPAYQWLWSQHDVINNHFRRYTRARLVTDLKRAGYKLNRASYAIAFSFPLVVASRFVSKTISREKPEEYSSFVKLPEAVNHTFISLLRLEAKAHRRLRLPFGTSVLATATKPTKSSGD